MSTDYRALCTELAKELVNEYGYCTEWGKGLPLCESNVSELLDRVRTALAQPEPQWPIAAALRAAADQVVPVTPRPNDTFCCPPVDTIVWQRVAKIRAEFLAIAAELEGGANG